MTNRYHDLPDIVARSGLDRVRAQVLHSVYDSFFKVASGLDVADKADGNVEAPSGWYSFIDMTGDKHDEVVASVYDLAPAYDEDEIPGPGIYVTQENTLGIVWAYEFATREDALAFYDELDKAYTEWLDEGEDES